MAGGVFWGTVDVLSTRQLNLARGEKGKPYCFPHVTLLSAKMQPE